jgi:hypothetical protein
MASFFYTDFRRGLLSGEFDLHTAGDDIRELLVMTNTTADTQEDSKFISDITTLDEYDGASYARKAYTGEVVAADNTNNRGEFDAADVQYATLGVGTRQAQARIIYKHVGADSANLLIAFVDSGGFPFDGNGGNVDVVMNAEGIIHA